MFTNTLIIDERKELPAKYKKILEDGDNQVTITSDITQALNFIKTQEPDLIIISDSIKEELAAFCMKIRVLTYNMRPVIVAMSKSSEIDDRINALKNGADDFISEPINTEEFKMRILAHLRREYESYIDIKTNLPNKNYCTRAIKRAINSNGDWGALSIRIKHFEGYKTAYTELASDKILKTFVAIIASGLDKSDFLGSLNENEFLIITNTYKLEKIASYLTFAFDSVKEKFYSIEDVKRGYMLIQGDEYAGRREEFMSVIIGGVNNEHNHYHRIEEVLEDLSHTRSLADKPANSNYLIQRPKISTPDSVAKKEVNNRVLIIETDEAMQILLTETLKLQGLETKLISEVEDLKLYNPAIAIVDVTGDTMAKHTEMYEKLKDSNPSIKIIVTSNEHDKEAILSAGADFYLPKPYEILILIKWVEYFLKEINNY